MSDEKLQTGIIAILIGALTGLYGLFIRHVIGHPDRVDIRNDIKELDLKKQSIASCEQIVRRFDGNHQETCKKLDHLINLIERKQND